MMPTLKRLAMIVLVAAGLPACATITTGTSQSLTVLTEPAGAACTLTRDGTIVGVVNPSPGTITISKSTRDVAIRCTRQGNLPGVTTATPQFQAMTAGNLLLGGVIGLGIDAASGALSYYPANVLVTLPPESFSSEQSREGFFIQRAADIRRLYDERALAVRSSCTPGDRQACDTRIGALERERNEELGRLDAQRFNTRVGG